MSIRDRFTGLPLWAKIIGYVVAGVVAFFLVARLIGALQIAFFGDPRLKQERANTTVAQEQTHAEANIADQALNTVHERDVYREHVTRVVHDGQEKVHAVDRGQQMDPDIDAAVADGLCSLHDDLCRRPAGPAPLQPVR